MTTSFITLRKVPFQFTSTSVHPECRWQRCGEGTALLEMEAGQLRVQEEGVWWEAEGDVSKRHAFQKSFALVRDPQELIYCKHMPDGTVLDLLTLTAEGKGRWFSPSPHLCGEDIYRAELQVDNHTLRIRWHSQGPEKDYRLDTTYKSGLAVQNWFGD